MRKIANLSLLEIATHLDGLNGHSVKIAPCNSTSVHMNIWDFTIYVSISINGLMDLKDSIDMQIRNGMALNTHINNEHIWRWDEQMLIICQRLRDMDIFSAE